MMTPTPDDDLAIRTVLVRYATAIDEHRWELLDDVFAPDATIDFTRSGGPAEGSLDAFREWLRSTIGLVPITRHHLSNVRVEVDGDTASSATYLHNPLADETGRVFLTIGGTYEDRWVRTDGGWRIVERTFTTTWFNGELPDGIEIGGA